VSWVVLECAVGGGGSPLGHRQQCRLPIGWLYVALVLDLYARKLVGWAMSETMPQELTLQALDVALGWRNPDAGLAHHSDPGSQYAAKDYYVKGVHFGTDRAESVLGVAVDLATRGVSLVAVNADRIDGAVNLNAPTTLTASSCRPPTW